MENFFEIDFLNVESKKSGDAISLRYCIDGLSYIHVVDGGFQDTGSKVVEHIDKYYGSPSFIDHVIATHPDGDHAGGLRIVLETYNVGALWMLRPWIYVDELIPRFARYSSTDNLKERLREIYPNIAALEEIALRRGISIHEPFQGTSVGAFHVMAPTKARYLDLIVDSEKTPESAKGSEPSAESIAAAFQAAINKAVEFIRAAWGIEKFSDEETSAENEMSVVQYAYLCEKRVLLTGDAGRSALTEAADYADYAGLTLPGIDRFQVPHHGSRRNVSTQILDRWLGPRLALKPDPGSGSFMAFISAAKMDSDHPRKAVVRAMIHRGADVYTSESGAVQTGTNYPSRDWSSASPLGYPEDQEA